MRVFILLLPIAYCLLPVPAHAAEGDSPPSSAQSAGGLSPSPSQNLETLVLKLKIANLELALDHMELQKKNLDLRSEKLKAQLDRLTAELKSKEAHK